MGTIRDLFAKPIDRKIEEVIKVDQADEQTVLTELGAKVTRQNIAITVPKIAVFNPNIFIFEAKTVATNVIGPHLQKKELTDHG